MESDNAGLFSLGCYDSNQNAEVSSAPALITVLPSGDKAICKTLEVWPVSSACLTIEGYFHILRDHSKAHTCDLESTELINEPLLIFQNFMHLSAVPPPDASTLGCHGHQAKARTAA
ncbi:hypothetical protein FF38_07384 [Lucilia cuprina]|uniref:Uncharacterized protein n=1 Tax=Lucilia cuprina TaxID=7375 RepID=A0A0L0CCZ0_LUCCU|nr:hypothetical protein FF38_07384 [Lucilia cuprina]